MRLEDLNRVIVHQANPRLVRKLGDFVGLDKEVVPDYGRLTGNIASASIPVTLTLAHEERPFRDGDLVALVAVGAGMTAGAAVLRWYDQPAGDRDPPHADQRPRQDRAEQDGTGRSTRQCGSTARWQW
ncbi:3-oxoacyl-[acyl-carrier-protein] synthase III C-terminal domain-containing protein [Streptomyces sp. M19]